MNNKSHFSDLPDLVTVREVADYLRVHPATVRRMIKTKHLKSFSLGGKTCQVRIPKDEIEKLLR